LIGWRYLAALGRKLKTTHAASARRTCSPRLLAASARRVCSPRLLAASARRVCSPHLLPASARRTCSPRLLAASVGAAVQPRLLPSLSSRDSCSQRMTVAAGQPLLRRGRGRKLARLPFPQRLLEPEVRERVRALVPGMPGMAAHPVPLDLVPIGELREPLPEVLILHGLLIRRAPAAPPPRGQPLD